ncbi:MAG TPA: hypothetical protein VF278_18630, partial [Pirellulales bacterium]
TLKLKARYMNLAEVVRWGGDMLKLFEHLPPDLPVSREQLEEKFGWLQSLRRKAFPRPRAVAGQRKRNRIKIGTQAKATL